MPRWKRFVMATVITIVLLTALLIFAANRTIIPVVTAVASQRSVTVINDVINASLIDAITAFGLTSEDFYFVSVDETGRLNSLSVNTILVAQVAARLATDISGELSADSVIDVSVPMGLFSGVAIFAGLGPSVNFGVIPTGDATVEYETSFTWAGINQVNFQVWLTVETNMRIVIPLQDTFITVSRRVPLVNTIFAGEVPPGMLLTDLERP